MTTLDQDQANRGFRAGLARADLLIPVCNACGQRLDYSQRFCPNCDSDAIGWAKASGRGRLRSVVEISVSYLTEFPAPYRIAFVALEEGPHLLGSYESARDLNPPGQEVVAHISGGRLVFRPIPTNDSESQ